MQHLTPDDLWAMYDDADKATQADLVALLFGEALDDRGRTFARDTAVSARFANGSTGDPATAARGDLRATSRAATDRG